ncbi:MAG TPA: hypothetical protein PLE95_13880, partial [Bacteroidales bacterium]|nr:hypothetical protein [Bacteroidales bacterium]
SPRGLVTILLLLGIPATSRISLIGEEVVTLVILLTLLFMMAGNFFQRKKIPFEPEVMIGSDGEVVTREPEDEK